MKIKPVEHKFGKPDQKPISFGILKEIRRTPYGLFMSGEYKNKRIEIYDAYKYKQKLIYVSDNKTLKWIKSKLIYIQDGIRKFINSEPR